MHQQLNESKAVRAIAAVLQRRLAGKIETSEIVDLAFECWERAKETAMPVIPGSPTKV